MACRNRRTGGSKIHDPALMDTHHGVHATLTQQRHMRERTKGSVSRQHVAGLQFGMKRHHLR